MTRRRPVAVLLVVLVLLTGTTSSLVRAGHAVAAQQDPAAERSQQLIAEAVESGRLDSDTSLVYRAYALFGDSRLPEQYVGSGAFEDNSLFVEAKLNWDTLSPSTRDRLTPFLVRPTDSRSIFSAKQTANTPPQSGTQTAA